jgi:hypothetical protein
LNRLILLAVKVAATIDNTAKGRIIQAGYSGIVGEGVGLSVIVGEGLGVGV